MITRHEVAQKLNDYLHHRLNLDQIVSWAESVVARIGLADVRAFGLTWEDCEVFFTRLDYQVRLDAIPSR